MPRADHRHRPRAGPLACAGPDISVGEKSVAVAGTTVREVLDELFRQHPVLRGYVTDERGAMRHHVVAFVNGAAVSDKPR